MRPIDADVLKKDLTRFYDGEVTARELIDEQPTIETEPESGWISVKDRLPPYGEKVLVVNEAYEAKQGYTMYNSGVTIRDPRLDFTFWGHKVTHWLPFPEPPKGE